MGFDLKQSLKLSQQLLMTPQLQQAIKLLQLSRVELESFVVQQIAENPVLDEIGSDGSDEFESQAEITEGEYVSAQMDQAGNLLDRVSDSQVNQVDWESYAKPADISTSHQKPSSGREEQVNYENVVSKEPSLSEYLLVQISELDLNPQELSVGEHIIGNIDERGYFVGDVEQLVAVTGSSLDLVEGVLDEIQRLDPPGVGARDLRECLLIQLRSRGHKDRVPQQLVTDFLDEIKTHNFAAIAKGLKIPLEKVRDSVSIISSLEPTPGRGYFTDRPMYIVPDVYVFKLAGGWSVALNEEGLPHLKVSEMYQEMMGSLSKGRDKDREYLQEKIKSANWLIKSIQQRQKTIYKVTTAIVEKQTDFFELGQEHLKPMILRNVADEIGMHESTISRVTTNKFVHTPNGIFELKYFFSSSVSKVGGEHLASASVKKMIHDMIKSEDSKKPLADQKIVALLEEKGVKVARRTVAKYREQLGFLPSSKRKKFC